nr:serine/arginine-rich splicing factor SR45a-like isoform X2 [Coffea arabica]
MPSFTPFRLSREILTKREKSEDSATSTRIRGPRKSLVKTMSYSRRSRYSLSPSPYRRYDRSVSRSLSRSRSRSRDSSDAENPGNNLYVTGLSTRVTKRDLEKHFSTEGTVEDVHLVIDPWSRESRGFGFVTMASVKEADRCIKYLNHSVLEGRVITIEKARRRRGRTPTPGRYLGLRTIHGCSRSSSRSPRYSSETYSRSRSKSRSYSPYYGRRYSSGRSRSRSYSPYYSRRRSYSPYYAYYRRKTYSRLRSPCGRSPVSRRDRSYSPYHRDYSPDDRYRRRSLYRSISRSISPRYRRYSRRSYSRSVSPRYPRHSRRSYSWSLSPLPRKSSRRSFSRSLSPRRRKRWRRRVSRDSYSSRSSSRSCSASSRSVSRSVTPTSD